VKTRSLWPCLLGHAITNALAVVAIQLQLGIPGFTPEYLGKAHFQPLWFDLMGLLLFGCGLWVLIRAFKREGEHAVVQAEQ